MDHSPSTIKQCLDELIHCIEESQYYSLEERGHLLEAIRTSLVAYLKLKEFIQEAE